MRVKKLKYIFAFSNIAKEISLLSNCVSLQVGAVITKDNRIISIGYNGTPMGHENCSDVFPSYNKSTDREMHHEWSKIHEIHAEMNAILAASKEGISIKDSSMFITHFPCNDCLKNIVASGIKNIYFVENYDKVKNTNEAVKYCTISNVFMSKVDLEKKIVYTCLPSESSDYYIEIPFHE